MGGDEATEDSGLLPLLAMKGETPCAAALYSDALMNSSILFKLIRNAGDTCRGAGAAIMCYLIRNSKNTRREFSPLKLVPIANEPNLKRYYESFGCTDPSWLLLIRWTMRFGYD